jgi:hypothetical protein
MRLFKTKLFNNNSKMNSKINNIITLNESDFNQETINNITVENIIKSKKISGDYTADIHYNKNNFILKCPNMKYIKPSKAIQNYIYLEFNKNNILFYDFLTSLDTLLVNNIVKNSKKMFGYQIHLTTIEEFYVNTIIPKKRNNPRIKILINDVLYNDSIYYNKNVQASIKIKNMKIKDNKCALILELVSLELENNTENVNKLENNFVVNEVSFNEVNEEVKEVKEVKELKDVKEDNNKLVNDVVNEVSKEVVNEVSKEVVNEEVSNEIVIEEVSNQVVKDNNTVVNEINELVSNEINDNESSESESDNYNESSETDNESIISKKEYTNKKVKKKNTEDIQRDIKSMIVPELLKIKKKTIKKKIDKYNAKVKDFNDKINNLTNKLNSNSLNSDIESD